MEPMMISIQQHETGLNIKKLLADNGYTVKEVQTAMGFENPQAVYKWLAGKTLPSIDNLLILSRLLNTSIENILVTNEDVLFLLTHPLYRAKLHYSLIYQTNDVEITSEDVLTESKGC